MLVILVSFVSLSWIIFIQDFETNYVDTNISSVDPINETLLQDIDKSVELNKSMKPILEGFEVLATEEGFFDKLLDLAVVIPLAIIAIPGVIFVQVEILVELISKFSNFINIPKQIILLAIVGLSIFILFKLASLWSKSQV